MLGNWGNYKDLTGDLYELKVKFGSGYRIYIWEETGNKVILLWGGSKGGKKEQDRDIKKVRKYWDDYNA